jgi:hypothetical protein
MPPPPPTHLDGWDGDFGIFKDLFLLLGLSKDFFLGTNRNAVWSGCFSDFEICVGEWGGGLYFLENLVERGLRCSESVAIQWKVNFLTKFSIFSSNSPIQAGLVAKSMIFAWILSCWRGGVVRIPIWGSQSEKSLLGPPDVHNPRILSAHLRNRTMFHSKQTQQFFVWVLGGMACSRRAAQYGARVILFENSMSTRQLFIFRKVTLSYFLWIFCRAFRRNMCECWVRSKEGVFSSFEPSLWINSLVHFFSFFWIGVSSQLSVRRKWPKRLYTYEQFPLPHTHCYTVFTRTPSSPSSRPPKSFSPKNRIFSPWRTPCKVELLHPWSSQLDEVFPLRCVCVCVCVCVWCVCGCGCGCGCVTLPKLIPQHFYFGDHVSVGFDCSWNCAEKSINFSKILKFVLIREKQIFFTYCPLTKAVMGLNS